jgi:hypothetical protein
VTQTATILNKRDTKAKPHLEQYAPVWLADEKIVPEDEAVIFSVIFNHKDSGWVNRRYRYDGFNNVLYYRGQTTLSEDATISTQENEPYINTLTTNMPNSYGG